MNKIQINILSLVAFFGKLHAFPSYFTINGHLFNSAKAYHHKLMGFFSVCACLDRWVTNLCTVVILICRIFGFFCRILRFFVSKSNIFCQDFGWCWSAFVFIKLTPYVMLGVDSWVRMSKKGHLMSRN